MGGVEKKYPSVLERIKVGRMPEFVGD